MADLDHKYKAIDINTESLKLYITIGVASIAGIITYHNSSNIIHNEFWFIVTLILLLICVISSIVCLNTMMTYVDDGKIDIGNKHSVIINSISILFFAFSIISGSFYLTYSIPKKVSDIDNSIITEGVVIKNNDIYIGKDVRTKIKISKDSLGRIKEVIISDSLAH